MIHTIYAQNPSDSPEEELVIQEVFVKQGDEVRIGALLLVVEGAKVIFDVESNIHGHIFEVLVNRHESVQIGQPLIKISEMPTV